MLIRAASDLHGHLPEVAPCDLLILAGDLIPLAVQDSEADSRAWLDSELRAWLDRTPAKRVVATAGNHDHWAAAGAPPAGLRWTFLVDEGTIIGADADERLRIWASPWTPVIGGGGWAFEASNAQQEAVADRIPKDIDLLVLHSPLRGFGDRARRQQIHRWDPAYDHIGSRAYRWAVQRIQPAPVLCVFGHAHGDGGWQGRFGETLCANVAVLNERYRPARAPVAFELDRDAGGSLRARTV